MIRVGIIGYGNLGRGVECAVNKAPDMQLMAVFTRRDPGSVNILSENVEVASVDTVTDWVGKIDVMILCGGSATDLEAQTPQSTLMWLTALILTLRFYSTMVM